MQQRLKAVRAGALAARRRRRRRPPTPHTPGRHRSSSPARRSTLPCAPMPAPRSSATGRRRTSSTSIASSTARLRALPPQRPGTVDAYVVSIALDSDPVFGREARAAGEVLQRRYGAAGRTIVLAGSDGAAPSRCRAASPATLAIALARIAELMDESEDALILYTTSHGAPVGLYYNDGDSGYGAISPNRLRRCSTSSASRNRLLILSACYSGMFVPRLQSDAERDRHRRRGRSHLLRLRRRERLDLLRRRDDQPCAAQAAAARRRFRRGATRWSPVWEARVRHRPLAAADQLGPGAARWLGRARAADAGRGDPAGRPAGGRNDPCRRRPPLIAPPAPHSSR